MSNFPSPSRSTSAEEIAGPTTLKFILDENEEVVIVLLVGNVTMYGFPEYAVKPFVVTVIGKYVAPDGTVTVSVVSVAVLTNAFTPPKKTMLFTVVVLKLVPVIVTTLPTFPEAGENEIIVGI